MKRSLPLLETRHCKPMRTPVLIPVVNRMTSRQMMVRIQISYQSSSFMCPDCITKAVKIISKIPCDIRVSRKPCHCIAYVTSFVFGASNRMRRRTVPTQDDGDDHILLTSVLQHSLESLPMIDIEPGK